MRAYVNAHMADEALTADTVVQALGLPSVRSCARIGLGQPLGAFIRAVRLERAAQLLAETDLPIIQVAFEVGYGSHEALTHAFRRDLGMTPSAFRHHARTIKPNDQTG